jgi:cytochrome c oxidase subunit II
MDGARRSDPADRIHMIMELGPTFWRARLTRVPRLGAAAAGLALAGCGLLDSPATTLLPRSDFGWTSHRIFLQILRWDTAIFLVVQALLLVAIFRFRERDPQAIPKQVRGSAVLEIIWTLLPAVILTFIAFPTVAAIFRTQTAPPKDTLRVKVIGHQWWWEFHYPDLGVTTASDLHLPAGRPVSLEIASTDVIHSFWVPPLGGKRDAIPGSVTRIVLTADTPGVYYGQCAEFCGASHANMRHLAVVDAPDAFAAWAAQQKEPAPTPPDGSAAATGLQVFRAGTCVGCHAVRGVSAGGIGPDLTHFGSRKTLAGGMLPNTPEHLARWVRHAPAVKPGSLMPEQKLSDPEVAALVAYLQSLR